jgi:hypothetical protein
MIAVFVLVSIVCTLVLPETRGSDLDDAPDEDVLAAC